MPWKLLIPFGVSLLLGRLFFRRSIGCLLWIIVVLALFFAFVPMVRADDLPSKVVSVHPLVPALSSPQSKVARGTFFSVQRVFVLDVPNGAKVWLSGDDRQLAPFQVDDELALLFDQQGRASLRISHDFRRRGSSGIDSFGPLELTGMLIGGQVSVTIQLIDREPPLYGASPLYLMVLAPEESPGTATPEATIASMPAAVETPSPVRNTPEPTIPTPIQPAWLFLVEAATPRAETPEHAPAQPSATPTAVQSIVQTGPLVGLSTPPPMPAADPPEEQGSPVFDNEQTPEEANLLVWIVTLVTLSILGVLGRRTLTAWFWTLVQRQS